MKKERSKTVSDSDIGEYFRFIGQLSRDAAAGDENARLMLQLLGNTQEAQTRNLELQIERLDSEIALKGVSQVSKAIANLKGSE